MKPCLDCGDQFPLSEFPIKDRGRRGPRCRTCHAEYVKPIRKLWYMRNQERKKAKTAKYRAENPDKIKAQRSQYRAKNRDKIRAKDNAYGKVRAHKKRAHAATYRARKRQQVIQLTYVQRMEMYEIYKRCQLLSRTTGEPHHVDHIVPLAHKLVCGLHVPWNLQVIPGRLNTRKRNNAPLDTLTLTHINLRHANEADHERTEGAA